MSDLQNTLAWQMKAAGTHPTALPGDQWIGPHRAKICSCKQCGKPYLARMADIKRGKCVFCSYACRGTWRKARNAENRPDPVIKPIKPIKAVKPMPPVKTCRNCGAFVIEGGQKYYCSKECAKEGIKSYVLVESTCVICSKVFKANKYDIAKGMGNLCSVRCMSIKRGKASLASKPYSHTRGGKREDLNGRYFRSSWEANYARYLNWLVSLGHLSAWEYEPDTFWFNVKRGNNSYTPDFKIFKKDGTYEYHEIKGWMDKTSATKLKRMGKFYPSEKVIVIDKKQYYALARDVRNCVQGWEMPERVA